MDKRPPTVEEPVLRLSSSPLESFEEFERFLSHFTNYERAHRYDPAALGVERMRSFAAELGAPHECYPSIHVAGTKGKGSTCLILEALLGTEGYGVGTYLSPHVEHLRERIRIHGRPANDEDLLSQINSMLPVLAARKEKGSDAFPSFFELMTALSMSCYRARRVDWGIFEVGLGGRLDATNILKPRICAITSIGLEHTQQLGKTLADIAREKAGIIKHGTPVVLGPLPAEAMAEVERIAVEHKAPLLRVPVGQVSRGRPGTLRLAEVPGELSQGALLGPALRMDLSIALTMFRRILELEGRPFRAECVASALSMISLPARIEIFRTRPAIALDAAHTAESVAALRVTLEENEFPRPRTLIFSISAGKELEPILKELPCIAEEVILTLADPIRSVPPSVLREELGQGEICELPEEALKQALLRGKPTVVTGSFYLAGKLRPMVRALERASK